MAPMADRLESSDAASDAGSEDSAISESSKVKVEIEKFQEDESAVAMALEEEKLLRDLMDKKRADLGVNDDMLEEAKAIMDKIEVERTNDHGKPWKPPPPVVFSTEYWKEWRNRVKVDKMAVISPEERRRIERKKEMEKRMARPSVRAPLPVKFDRNGKKTYPVANFSQPFYNEKKDPRVPPKKAAKKNKMEENRAVKEVRSMMKAFGVDDGGVTSEDLERAISMASPAKAKMDKLPRKFRAGEGIEDVLPD